MEIPGERDRPGVTGPRRILPRRRRDAAYDPGGVARWWKANQLRSAWRATGREAAAAGETCAWRGVRRNVTISVQ